MAKKIVIIGAVALGPKVACRLKRLDANAEITLLDRDNLISYGGCGIPYYVGGDISDLEDLYSTSAHIIRDRHFFENCKGINVRTEVEAVAINRDNSTVTIRNLRNGRREHLAYDKLVLATGATPVRPPFPGSTLKNVFILANLHEAERLKTLMSQGKVGTAVVIGGGAIGVEICEAMTDLWSIATHLVEMEDQVLPTLLGKCIARIVKAHLEEKGVKVLVEDRVDRISVDNETGMYQVKTTKTTITTDIGFLCRISRLLGKILRP